MSPRNETTRGLDPAGPTSGMRDFDPTLLASVTHERPDLLHAESLLSGSECYEYQVTVSKPEWARVLRSAAFLDMTPKEREAFTQRTLLAVASLTPEERAELMERWYEAVDDGIKEMTLGSGRRVAVEVNVEEEPIEEDEDDAEDAWLDAGEEELQRQESQKIRAQHKKMKQRAMQHTNSTSHASRTARHRQLRQDGSIRTATRTIERVFGLPKGAVRLVLPSGRKARTDKTIGALLRDWM